MQDWVMRNDIREIEPIDGWKRYEIVKTHYIWKGQEITEEEFKRKLKDNAN